MIKCENECLKGKFEGCCFVCPFKDECDEACDSRPDICSQSIYDESAGLIAFKDSSVAVIKQVCDICTAKKATGRKGKRLERPNQTGDGKVRREEVRIRTVDHHLCWRNNGSFG